MKSSSSLLTAAFVVLGPVMLLGQVREHFDMVSYLSPRGWKKETNNAVVSYVITNSKTGEWCRISVFRSMGSSGDLTADFDHEWNELVAKTHDGIAKPTPEVVPQGGWTVQSGAGNFTWQNRQSIILLNVISGFGRVASITVSMNGREFKTQAEEFLDSIEMQKPEGYADPMIAEPPLPTGLNDSGITKSTTHFDDGWTAVVQNDHIVLTKENTRYYSYYGIPGYNSGGEKETTQYHWNRLVEPRYTITNLWLNPDVQSIGYFNYYAEGTGIDKRTGNNVFIGFRVIIESGVDFCTLAASPSKEEYLRHFPNLDALKIMRNANRFAVTKEDLLGDWSSSSSSALQYYNVYTGQSAGMQFSQGGQEFYFRSNGEYNANISGAMGTMGGPQVVFDNKYKGNFSVTDWEITMTGYGGITQVFTAYFEALQGGRVLHIAKKDAPGVHYPLIKVK
ncbi:MAG: hypothetical protein JNJ65_03960 [Cyclobacteriaceae bacterium]|nr:hypothetical protein [Cyclobacteriaceae bacterium]